MTAFLVLAGAAPGQNAAAGGKDGQKGRETIVRWLAGIAGASAGQITALDDAYVKRAIPAQEFFVLRFRLYPVAPPIPESLTASNLLAVQQDGSVKQIPDVGVLETVFRSALAPVTSRERAEDATRAWLRLSQEFQQDGFFHFTGPDVVAFDSGEDGIRVSGRALVLPDAGDQGVIRVTLTFDRGGRLVKASESAQVVAGHRPI